MSARKKPASTTTTAPISGATTSPFGGVAAFNNSSLVQSLRAQAAATGESVAGSDNVDGKASMMRYLMKLAKNPKLRKYAKKYGKKLMKMSQKEAKKFLEEKAKEADDKSGNSTMLARMQSFGKHVKCVTSKPDSYPERAVVPPDVTDEDALPWNTTGCKPREEYAPPYFDHPVVLSNNERLVSKTKGNNGWADPACPRSVDWSARVSHYGTILIDAATGYPMNPVGLTGMMGRGLLGKWGPNHAGDAIVTRCVEGKVQVVAIKRRDNGQWALPGGMKDHGESLAATVIREFSEEAARPREGDKADLSSERHASSMYVLDEMKASGGSVIFKGYVDDPRNTDNAWMETQAVHFDLRPDQWDRLHLGAGDDAAAVVWMDTDDSDPRYKNFYASHKHWVDYVKRHYPKDGDKKRTRSS